MKTGETLSFAVLILLIVSTSQQNNICYSNCREGFCSPSDPRECTECDLGLVNINGRCVSSSSQPFPLTTLTTTENEELVGATSELFSCQVSNSSFFNDGSVSSLIFMTIPGTTYTLQYSIPERHEFIQIRFNAAIVQNTQSLLEYQIFSNGQLLVSERQIPTQTELTVNCLNVQNVRNLFNVRSSFSSSASEITIQIRSLDANAVFGVSNFELYYGSCNSQCQSCTGSSIGECLSCQGFYMEILEGVCQTCPTGFYDSRLECRACPQHCATCEYNSGTLSAMCLTCDSYATLNQSTGFCQVSFQAFSLARTLNFDDAQNWTSSATNQEPLSQCGKYSLIGGISIGRQSSSLSKTYTNLQVHSVAYLSFSLVMIDQQQDSESIYQIFIDGQLYSSQEVVIRPEETSYTLSDECGSTQPELIIPIKLLGIPHSQRNLTVAVRSFKDYFGIRDVVLTVNNGTDVLNCFQTDEEGQCTQCLNALSFLNQSCSRCASGYYLKSSGGVFECQICPIQCATCETNLNNEVVCTSCASPLELIGEQCKDTSGSLYSREIIPSVVGPQQNDWILYPKLPQKGLDTCNGDIILGSSEIRYKFLSMKRFLTDLPSHRGVRVVVQMYQIDDFSSDSVFLLVNGERVDYTPTLERKQICGNSTPDAIVKLEFERPEHADSNFNFEVHVNGKVKVGINNFMVYLLNCENCGNRVSFELETTPIYSLSTPPQKGLEVKLVFAEEVANRSSFSDVFRFSIANSSQQANEQGEQSRLLQGVINLLEDLPTASEELRAGREYVALLPLTEDFNNQHIESDPVRPLSVVLASTPSRALSSVAVSQEMPRYIDISQDEDTNDRTNLRNLKNLFQGCAIVALWVGIASFLFGLSPALDDFFILVQVVFVHIFVQYSFNPPSFRLPLEGMQVVQFMAWLPKEARESIEEGIIPESLYQRSPIPFEQYWEDIVFARTIYHTVLFLALVAVVFAIIKIVTHIVFKASSNNKQPNTYFFKYYQDYQSRKFVFLDKVLRFAYFTVAWACALQFIEFSNDPDSFNIWNGILCILFFVVVVLYPIVGFVYLRRVSNTLSEATFDRNYEEVRISSARLFHFIFRYYRLLAIALLIALLHDANPLIILIPLIVLHIADAVIILALRPFGMNQEQQLNVCFYNGYPKAYRFTTAIERILFALLELFLIILYAVRDDSSSDSYMGLGYFLSVLVILLLLNGVIRMVWGFFKIIEGCYSRTKEMKLQVEQKVLKEEEFNHEEMVPMKSVRDTNNLQSIQSRSRLNSVRRQSYVSRIN